MTGVLIKREIWNTDMYMRRALCADGGGDLHANECHANVCQKVTRSQERGMEKIPWDFPGGPVVNNLPCNAGDIGQFPGQGTKIPYEVKSESVSRSVVFNSL